MAKEVKIIKVLSDDLAQEAEKELTKLVNDGWVIVAAGGYGGLVIGFVVLQRER